MFHEKPKRRRLRRAVVLLVLLAVLAAEIVMLGRRIGSDMREQAAAALEQSVVQAAVQCYAIEGVYPPSLEYLEENYGLTINRQDFIVTYDVFASNQMPEIAVLRK